ncbi:c-type cytochrome biogenesis protein CcmI [Rhodopila sp.]|uniref:c-type cytochrome biogenesis protein CcmI n=1 Tax=Rhodopila sp. TaxID=2480087 RepID=UPI002CBAF150|nr:c-type cytochrome biogenesis protein CcmI [Rhodopila sp.]HVZ07406.1 c-type cytochrome biogenesis protein CcmI [Rhodopila sp.]
MIFPFLLATLAFLTLVAVVAPLLRGRSGSAASAEYDRAVYRDQLAELDRDIERGLITADEAVSARLEIQRRLLVTQRQGDEPAAPARSSRRGTAVAAVLFLVIAGGSLVTYLWIGTPGLPDMPFADRPPASATAAGKEQNALQQAAEQLAAKLKDDPKDGQSWAMLGRTRAMLGQFDDAVSAYREAIAQGQTDPETMGSYGEVQVLATGGTVTPAAEETFRKVLTADPTSGIARYYLGVAANQAGEPKKAITLWRALLADLPSDSPERAQIAGRIADAARTAGVPMPDLPPGTAPAAQAAPNGEQQQAMIASMVARLAAKQDADPTNLDGWLRLGRAYSVLHDTDKAMDAFDKAMALKPDDASIPLQAVQDLTRSLDPRQALPPRVVALLRKVQLMHPKEPVVLWFLGIAALQGKHPEDAKRYWTELLTVLPASSADAKTVQEALDMLAKATAPKTGG